ncbi:DUF6089 family protein [Flavitalea sp.]|nr:DUF6089 family protein [Flavitalea sp.]
MRALVICFLFIPIFSFSQQRLHITAFGGFANYSGDLQTKRLTLDQSHGTFGLGLKYDITNHFSARAGINYGRIEGNDKKNEGLLKARNLNFQSGILEGNLMIEYTLLDLSERKFSPYVFAGVAIYHFNPYTYDTLGNKFNLQPLGTEGQGLSLYPDRKPYNLTQFAIPFGAGLKLRVSDNVVLSYEMGLRKLFTDYLDDVSSTYVDQSLLGQARGPRAVEMAYRGGELKGGDLNYPADGSVRGGAKYKDWYYFTGLGISIGIGSITSPFSGGRSKYGNTGCPTNL